MVVDDVEGVLFAFPIMERRAFPNFQCLKYTFNMKKCTLQSLI